ncbi:hypothetical protein LSAT2_015507 [Lamellibrachia satsuma]|nr:hypothetical protein LSAT2_015507 [Lamellibrachia satsuma]
MAAYHYRTEPWARRLRVSSTKICICAEVTRYVAEHTGVQAYEIDQTEHTGVQAYEIDQTEHTGVQAYEIDQTEHTGVQAYEIDLYTPDCNVRHCVG